MNKEEFLTGVAPEVVTGGKAREFKKQIRKLSQIPVSIRWFIWGHQKTGKTFVLASLLEAGYKILVLDSDMGGNGLLTVVEYLTSKDKRHLLDNLYHIPFDYKAADTFFTNPAAYFKEHSGGVDLWSQFNPDIIAWEGFGTFQQQDITEHVMKLTGAAKKETDELALAPLGYQYLQNATGQFVDDFYRLANPLTGFSPHKILQAHVDDRPVNAADGSKVSFDKVAVTPTIEGGKPWLQGQGAKFPSQGADYGCRLIAEIKKVAAAQGKPASTQTTYYYDFSTDRGVGGFYRGNVDRWLATFPSFPKIPADPARVFQTMLAISQG
jgi:hypothetical protein